MPDDKPSKNIKEKSVEKSPETNVAVPQTPPDNPPAPPTQSITEESLGKAVQAIEDRVKRPEWLMIRLTAGIVVLTLGLVIVGMFQWNAMNGQLREMKTQSVIAARSLEVTQRPWVSADIAIAGPFAPDTNGVHASVRLTLKNGGLSPATRLEYAVEIYLMFHNDLIVVAERERFCKAIIGRSGSQEALFAGTPLVQDWQLGIGAEDLQKHSIPNTVAPFNKIIPANVIACVAYHSLISSETYYTGYIYNLMTDKGALLYPPPIPANRLRLMSLPQFGAVIAR